MKQPVHKIHIGTRPCVGGVLETCHACPSSSQFVDNEQSLLVVDAKLERDLPENLKSALTEATRTQQQHFPQQDTSPQQSSQIRLSSIITSVLRPSGSQGGTLAAVAGQGIFRNSKPGYRAAESELAPLFEEPSSTAPKIEAPAPTANTASNALAAALLVAAGKRAPGLSAGSAGARAQFAKGSHELFSYLGQLQQQQQQQQGRGAAAAPATTSGAAAGAQDALKPPA